MNLDHLRKQLRDRAAAVGREVAAEVQSNLKAVAPVESGDLRDSISATSSPLPSGNVEIEVEIDSPYAWRMRQEWQQQLDALPETMRRIWHRIP